MATRLTTNTTTVSGNYFIIGSQGDDIASADTITISTSFHEVTGSTTINTINGGLPGMGLYLFRPTGASWALGSSGNIKASDATQAERVIALVTPDGTTWYGQSTVSDTIQFTPYGHISAVTVQDAIQELVDEKTNTPNLTEDTTPDTANDLLTTWDNSASAYKKVKIQNIGINGPLFISDGSSSAPSIALGSDPDTGIRGNSTEKQIIITCNGTDEFVFDTSSLCGTSATQLAWTSGTVGGTKDTILYRVSDGVLAVKSDGTSAAELRVYADGSTATQYGQLTNSSTLTLLKANGGPLALDTSSTYIQWRINGTVYGAFTGTAIAPQTTNVLDLGTTSQFVKSAYVSTSIQGTRSKALTAGAATTFCTIACATGSFVGGYVEYTIHANDATDYQARSGILCFAAVNKAGSEIIGLFRPDGTTTVDNTTDGVASSLGTLTNTFTAVAGTEGFDLKANAASSLTETTLNINYRVVITSGTATVTPA